MKQLTEVQIAFNNAVNEMRNYLGFIEIPNVEKQYEIDLYAVYLILRKYGKKQFSDIPFQTGRLASMTMFGIIDNIIRNNEYSKIEELYSILEYTNFDIFNIYNLTRFGVSLDKILFISKLNRNLAIDYTIDYNSMCNATLNFIVNHCNINQIDLTIDLVKSILFVNIEED